MSEAKTKQKEPCPEFPYFGAHYPDARCVDGQLHDLDKCDDNGNLYAMDEDVVCPFCRRKEFLKQEKDNGYDLEKTKAWIEAIRKKYA